MGEKEFSRLDIQNPFKIIAYMVCVNECLTPVKVKDHKRDGTSKELKGIQARIQARKEKEKLKNGVVEEPEDLEPASDTLDVIVSFMSGELKQPYESIMKMNFTTINNVIKKVAEKAEERDKDGKVNRVHIEDMNLQKM